MADVTYEPVKKALLVLLSTLAIMVLVLLGKG